MTELKLGCSPITYDIFVGKTKIDKNGYEVWTGTKTEVTESAMDAVISRIWYMQQEGKHVEYYIKGKKHRLKLEEVEE